jgi:hypothetical protein
VLGDILSLSPTYYCQAKLPKATNAPNGSDSNSHNFAQDSAKEKLTMIQAWINCKKSTKTVAKLF